MSDRLRMLAKVIADLMVDANDIQFPLLKILVLHPRLGNKVVTELINNGVEL